MALPVGREKVHERGVRKRTRASLDSFLGVTPRWGRALWPGGPPQDNDRILGGREA